MAIIDFPASPADGQQYLAPNNIIYQYYAAFTAWLALGGANNGAYISSTPPANVFPGMFWWSNETGSLFIYYVDATSAQWVPTNPAAQQMQAGILRLYSEQVCLGGETQMNVLIPANAKRIEIDYISQAAAGDPSHLLQSVESGVPNASSNHSNQSMQGQASGVAASGATGTSWNMGASARVNFSVKMFPLVGTPVWVGLVNNAFITSAALRYVLTHNIDGGANPATTTGFRVTLTSSSYIVNSRMRCYVVT